MCCHHSPGLEAVLPPSVDLLHRSQRRHMRHRPMSSLQVCCHCTSPIVPCTSHDCKKHVLNFLSAPLRTQLAASSTLHRTSSHPWHLHKRCSSFPPFLPTRRIPSLLRACSTRNPRGFCVFLSTSQSASSLVQITPSCCSCTTCLST